MFKILKYEKNIIPVDIFFRRKIYAQTHHRWRQHNWYDLHERYKV